MKYTPYPLGVITTSIFLYFTCGLELTIYYFIGFLLTSYVFHNQLNVIAWIIFSVYIDSAWWYSLYLAQSFYISTFEYNCFLDVKEGYLTEAEALNAISFGKDICIWLSFIAVCGGIYSLF